MLARDSSTDLLAIALHDASSRLARSGIDTARLDAELLMAEAAKVSRAQLVAQTARVDSAVIARFEAMASRRERREPLAYIIGRREFFSLEFDVDSTVLIPRPETETLVRCALDFLSSRPAASVLDIGTGSGAIAIAIVENAPHARLVATDISKASLEIAIRNARRHVWSPRISFLEGDCLAALPESLRNAFNLILSNPPYIPDGDFASLAPEVVDFEPRQALAGGHDGLEFFRRIGCEVARYLKPDGMLMVEVGDGQAEAVRSIFRDAGLVPTAARTYDLAGVERVVSAVVGP
jgi:release factor glutamine methyltransferase